MSTETPETAHQISRREAVRRVSALLGGVAFIGGGTLLTACERGDRPGAANGSYKAVGQFSAEDVAMLDEIADTILPTTAKSPGAKAAATGPFMALMVTDTYHAPDQQVFRDGLKKIDDATKKAVNVGFMQATPQQRLAVLTQLDKDQKTYMDARAKMQEAAAKSGRKVASGPQAAPEGTSGGQAAAAGRKAAGDSADKNLSDQRQENSGTGDAASGAMAADAPPHYFRMMKELAMLGFFTSEIGYTKAMRYVEAPGRFEGCTPYAKGEKAWAPHA